MGMFSRIFIGEISGCSKERPVHCACRRSHRSNRSFSCKAPLRAPCDRRSCVARCGSCRRRDVARSARLPTTLDHASPLPASGRPGVRDRDGVWSKQLDDANCDGRDRVLRAADPRGLGGERRCRGQPRAFGAYLPSIPVVEAGASAEIAGPLDQVGRTFDLDEVVVSIRLLDQVHTTRLERRPRYESKVWLGADPSFLVREQNTVGVGLAEVVIIHDAPQHLGELPLRLVVRLDGFGADLDQHVSVDEGDAQCLGHVARARPGAEALVIEDRRGQQYPVAVDAERAGDLRQRSTSRVVTRAPGVAI